MSESTVNDQIIQAVFAADDDAKVLALAILQGEEPPPPPIMEPEPGEPLLLGMGEGARLLGVSRATLWRMIKEGSLEKVELYHNSYRLRRSDIMELARTHTPPRWRTRKTEQAE